MFANYYEKKPALLRGAPQRTRGLLSLEELVGAIMGASEIRGKVQITKDHFRPDALPSPDFAARRSIAKGTEPLWAYVEGGHPILWNGARGVTGALDELTHDLTRALGAYAWPNIYSTGTAGSPFEWHFDAHEVLALQCDGRKEWHISNVRSDRPLDAPPLQTQMRAEVERRRDEASRDVLMTFVVEPGDVVYIPRGQFHCAWTPEGRSLHVTFGIEPLSGYHLLEALVHLALKDRAFRAFFPVEPMDRDGRRAREQRVELQHQLVALLQSGVLDRTLEALRERRIGHQGRPPATVPG